MSRIKLGYDELIIRNRTTPVNACDELASESAWTYGSCLFSWSPSTRGSRQMLPHIKSMNQNDRSGFGAVNTVAPKELNWEPLASHRRTARLVLFYKIHWFGSSQHATEAQLWTNSIIKLPGISHSCIVSRLSKEFILLPHSQKLELSSWRCCPYTTQRHLSLISILIIATIMHLEPLCYALSTAGMFSATGQESSTCWSLTVSQRKKERLCKVTDSGSKVTDNGHTLKIT